MNEFDFEVLQKKRIAQSAKYRKNGSKSKKCSMSTDYMTEKEWKERNGKVVSYYMNKPMKWEEFKNLPYDAQANYLSGLIERFGVNAANLGEMFGVSSQAIRRHLNSHDIGIKFQVGHSLNKNQRAIWRQFINQDNQIDELNITTNNSDDLSEEYENPAEFGVGSDEGNDEEKPVKRMNMDTFAIRFSGKLDPQSIYHSLLVMLSNDSMGELEIIYNKE